ncbi:MAG: M23 family metallopeptidase [Proteobacteria bacterium]|nr:M23 family metallopeptidase [Pseudomonadota bacterium]
MTSGTKIAATVGLVLGLALAGWWFTDGTAPVIADNELSSLPGSFVVGDLRVAIPVTDDRTGVGSVTATIDGEAVDFSDQGLTLGPSLGEGPHVLEAVARDRRGNESRRSWSFITDNVAPTFRPARSSLRGAQGRTLLLFVETSEPVPALTAQFVGTSNLMESTGPLRWRLHLGISAELEPGLKTLTLSAQDEAGNAAVGSVDVVIEETAFPRGGMINLSPAQIEARKNRPGVEEAARRRREAFGTEIDPSITWTGPFEMPVQDAIMTSPFGKVRDYSDGGVSRHLGTDYAAPRGTPVAAPDGGVVVLAEEMSIYGLVIILKHGAGLASSYNHLSEMLVEPGDVVERGDIIGKVGSTGQSTGPHLHWGMHVGGFAVAAEQWIEPGWGTPREDDFGAAP